MAVGQIDSDELAVISRASADALIVTAAHGLMGTRARASDAPLGAVDWRDLVEQAAEQRLTGLLAAAVHSGALPATVEQVAQIRSVDAAMVWHVLGVEATLVRTAQILEPAGIPFRVLKGTAVAHLDYPDPALRHFGDLDVLIRPEDFDRAIVLFAEHGCPRTFPQPRPGFDRRFTKSVSVATPQGPHIDVHRTLAPGPFGLRVDLDGLWKQPGSQFVLGGQPFEALGPDERFLHACYHSALGDVPPRLVPQRDIVQMLLLGMVDVARVHRLAAAWRGEAVVALAVARAWSTLRMSDEVPLSLWAARFRPGAREGRELAEATSPAKSYGNQALASVRAIPGVRDRIAYVGALAFPQRSYLEGRHAGFGERVKHIRAVVRNRGITEDGSVPRQRMTAESGASSVTAEREERS